MTISLIIVIIRCLACQRMMPKQKRGTKRVPLFYNQKQVYSLIILTILLSARTIYMPEGRCDTFMQFVATVCSTSVPYILYIRILCIGLSDDMCRISLTGLG